MRIDDMLPPPAHRPRLSYGDPQHAFGAAFNIVTWMVDRHVDAGDGERIALIQYPDGEAPAFSLTYRKLQAKVRAIAGALKSFGVKKGDRVLVGVREHPDAVAAVLATFTLGAVAVPCSVMVRAKEIAWYFEDLQPVVAILDETLRDEVTALRKTAACTWVLWSKTGATVEGFVPFEQLAVHAPIATPEPLTAQDWAIVFHTAGTTGRSKPCIHTQQALLASALAYNYYNLGLPDGAEPKPIATVIGPIGHAYGWLGKVLYPLIAGGTGVLIEVISGDALTRILRDRILTDLLGAAAVFKRFLLDAPPPNLDLKATGVKRIYSLMHEEKINRQLQEVTGLFPLNVYGSAPLGAIVTWAGRGEPLGSCGVPLPGYEIAIVPTEAKDIFRADGTVNELPDGTVGRMIIRGLTGTTYLNRDELARNEILHGWTLTDDIFERDSDGYLWFRGRISGIIKTSGFSVAPIEVEAALNEHPAVDRSAVIGIPDMDRGEAIKAIVQLKAGYKGSDALVKELQEQVRTTLAPYKYPRQIEFIDLIPLDPTGKIPYGELRRRERERAARQ